MMRTVRRRNSIWITKCKRAIVDNGISTNGNIETCKNLGAMEKECK